MDKVVCKPRLKDLNYDLYVNGKKVNAKELPSEVVDLYRTIAFVEYIQNKNSQMSEFFRRNDEEVLFALSTLIKEGKTPSQILTFFGIQPHSEPEICALAHLTKDVFSQANLIESFKSTLSMFEAENE